MMAMALGKIDIFRTASPFSREQINMSLYSYECTLCPKYIEFLKTYNILLVKLLSPTFLCAKDITLFY